VARIRTIKPEFFTSEDIVSLKPWARLLYIALWCEADREGRMTWKPGTYKLRYFPGDAIDINKVCGELLERGLVVLYGDGLACIPTFMEHQHINPREAQSVLPVPDASARVIHASPLVTDAQVGREGKEGREDASPTRGRKRPLPASWNPSNSTIDRLSREFGLRVPEDVERYVAAFRDACNAKGYQYADFDAAFCNCVRQDWPKLRGSVIPLPTAERKFAAPG
jgi:hypothetical protein